MLPPLRLQGTKKEQRRQPRRQRPASPPTPSPGPSRDVSLRITAQRSDQGRGDDRDHQPQDHGVSGRDAALLAKNRGKAVLVGRCDGGS
jgi:hypothetical protein